MTNVKALGLIKIEKDDFFDNFSMNRYTPASFYANTNTHLTALLLLLSNREDGDC